MKDRIGKTMVVGGGISGIRSALDLAQAGFQVILVEKSDHLGGLLSQLDFQFPTSTCGMCRMLPMFDRDRGSQHCLRRGLSHENIEVLLSCDLISVAGEPGDFTIALKQHTSPINSKLCIGCGLCENVCPVEVPDPFNVGLSTRKAVYRPCPQSFPNEYTIDTSVCTHCGECEKICPTQAITFTAQEKEAFKILVVDDEKIVRESMTEWLLEEGFGAVAASSGQKALELMEETDFHMMLTDIKMPGMDGVELLTRAKDLQPEMEVIMMTAYAAVDSAVEAMKQGALDYLIKPFEPDAVISMADKVYKEFETATARVEQVDALILSQGVDFFVPDQGKNPYGYGKIPGVVTSMEFERILSRTGPGQGVLSHPVTHKPIRKIAWFQCVGSRDRQLNAEFCSTACCMISIKEAMLAREKFADVTDASIFYMDMRTHGKTFDDYKDRAQESGQVKFIRSRIHSIAPLLDSAVSPSSDHIPDYGEPSIRVRFSDTSGQIQEQNFDMVVLATGQRPKPSMIAFAHKNDLETNQWGFIQPQPFSMTDTSRPGIFTGGSLTGLKDISESVICASAASMAAVETMQAAGKETFDPPLPNRGKEISREVPRIMIVLCQCSQMLSKVVDLPLLESTLLDMPEVKAIEITDKLCTENGWGQLLEKIKIRNPNRIVLGACRPWIQRKQMQALAEAAGLPVHLISALDISGIIAKASNPENHDVAQSEDPVFQQLKQGIKNCISKIKYYSPVLPDSIESFARALVVGGGIAGLTAALSMANSGFEVDLVEKESEMGGNLLWIQNTIEGFDTRQILDKTLKEVETHERISLHTQSMVTGSEGFPGQWITRLSKEDGTETSVRHGVVVLATGGDQAMPSRSKQDQSQQDQAKQDQAIPDPNIPDPVISDQSISDQIISGPVKQDLENSVARPGIYTQKAFQQALDDQMIDPEKPGSIAMVQCWDCREGDRNYCSRVCCPRSLQQALFLKEKNPDTQVYILYRDMMTPGFSEIYFSQAREAGVFFFKYDKGNRPHISSLENKCTLTLVDEILKRKVEIDVDYAVLSTGVVSNLSKDLAEIFKADLDRFGFFKEADPKWRPMEAIQSRVFACGLSLKPCSIQEAVTSARAVASRAVGILSQPRVEPGAVTARVRTTYCSLCELCIEACPFQARMVDTEQRIIRIDPLACQGCGVCASICPSGAAVVEGFSGQHMLDVIDTALSATQVFTQKESI